MPNTKLYFLYSTDWLKFGLTKLQLLFNFHGRLVTVGAQWVRGLVTGNGKSMVSVRDRRGDISWRERERERRDWEREGGFVQTVFTFAPCGRKRMKNSIPMDGRTVAGDLTVVCDYYEFPSQPVQLQSFCYQIGSGITKTSVTELL